MTGEIMSLNRRQQALVDGTIRLRGQNQANLDGENVQEVKQGKGLCNGHSPKLQRRGRATGNLLTESFSTCHNDLRLRALFLNT